MCSVPHLPLSAAAAVPSEPASVHHKIKFTFRPHCSSSHPSAIILIQLSSVLLIMMYRRPPLFSERIRNCFLSAHRCVRTNAAENCFKLSDGGRLLQSAFDLPICLLQNRISVAIHLGRAFRRSRGSVGRIGALLECRSDCLAAPAKRRLDWLIRFNRVYQIKWLQIDFLRIIAWFDRLPVLFWIAANRSPRPNIIRPFGSELKTCVRRRRLLETGRDAPRS